MKKDHALAMVEQAFQQGVKIGDISENTAKRYFGQIKTFFNTTLDEIKEQATDKKSRDAYNPKFWKAEWVEKHIDGLLDRFHGRSDKKPVSGSHVENCIHAFGKLQEIVKEHAVWKKNGIDKVRIGLKGSVEEGTGYLYKIYKEEATMHHDERTSMKATDQEYRMIINTIDKVIPKTNPNYETVKNIILAQRHTGGRITAEINLKAGNIDLENMTKHYEKDKNNFSRRVPMDMSQKLFYANLTRGKAEGSPLFPLFDKKGKQMSKEAASKYMQETYKKIAEKAGLVERDEKGKVTRRYTSHSTRRCFAQKLYDSTKFTSKKDLWKKIRNYVNLQGSNKEKIDQRIENERRRLNYYRLKKGLPMKPFTWDQMRKLYVMLHLGHSRTDTVGRCYVKLDPPLKRNFKKSN